MKASHLGIVIAMIVSATVATGCAAKPAPPQAIESSTSTSEAVVVPSTEAVDPMRMIALDGGLVVESTKASKLTAPDAIARAGDVSADGSATVVARKVVMTKGDIRDRLVWLVGAGPVMVQRHGKVPGPTPGQTVWVVDANSGKVLGEASGGLPDE